MAVSNLTTIGDILAQVWSELQKDTFFGTSSSSDKNPSQIKIK